MNALSLSNQLTKVEKLFNEFATKLDIRIKDDRTATSDYLEKFLEADPTENKIYLRWILDSYVNGGIRYMEDLGLVNSSLTDYMYLLASNKLQNNEVRWLNEKDILNYCGLIGCKKKGMEKTGLSSLLVKYNSILEARKEHKEETEETRNEGVLIFENNELKIVNPTTEKAACYYGKGTKWCTAADKKNMFDHYNEEGPLYIIIPKNPSYVGEKYQLHFEQEQYMNELDKDVKLDSIFDKFPSFKSIITDESKMKNYIDSLENNAAFCKFAFQVAIYLESLNSVKLLISDYGVDPSYNKNAAIFSAASQGDLELVRLLMADDRVNPADAENSAIHEAVENGHLETVRLLMTDDRVDPSIRGNWLINSARRNGHSTIVSLLLTDYRVKFLDACNSGDIEVVKLLLADERVDPSSNKNKSIEKASQNGHADVVRLLLADNRVNPADQDNEAIKNASENGHADVVRLLLADNRVNPADQDNEAIKRASEYGYADVVKLLLDDGRANPAASGNYPIRIAAQKGYVEVVRLLLQDKRVDALKAKSKKPIIQELLSSRSVRN